MPKIKLLRSQEIDGLINRSDRAAKKNNGYIDSIVEYTIVQKAIDRCEMGRCNLNSLLKI